MLGTSVESIRETFKRFNSLSDARGGTNFGTIHYTRIHALTEYVRDRQCHHNQVPDAAGFTDAVMRSYISKSEITDGNGVTLDVAELPKLGENNFHQWEDAIIAQLHAKKGTNNVPLAYVVRKPTPPENFADNTECLIYEASRAGPAWDEDKKTVGNYIIRLLATMPAQTWIKNHMASQDGSAMMASLCTHFLGPAQVKRIVQYARAKHDRATYKSQAIYSFECFSTNLQEGFDAEIPQAEQIRLLCEKIHTEKADFNAAAVTMLMDGTHAILTEAVTHVSQYVSHFFPASTTLSRGRGRANISSLNLSQVAHEQRGNKCIYNGVDITDFTHRYNHDKWMKLKDLWGQIHSEKDKREKGKAKDMVTTSKCAKALTKRIKSLTKRVSALQEQSDCDPKDPIPAPDTLQDGDDDDKATGPCTFRKKQKI